MTSCVVSTHSTRPESLSAIWPAFTALRGQPDHVDFPLTQFGLEDDRWGNALLALVHNADHLEGSGAQGEGPADGVGVLGLTPADMLAGPGVGE